MNTLRHARAADAAAIAEIYVETWQTSYAGMVPDHVLIKMSPKCITPSWQRSIVLGHDIILVALDETKSVIGFGSAGRNRDLVSPFDCEIYTLYVRPDFQNLGAGRLLLQGLFKAIYKRGFKNCELWVLADNPSRFFYAAVGGTLCGEKTERLWSANMRQLAYGWENIPAPEILQSR